MPQLSCSLKPAQPCSLVSGSHMQESNWQAFLEKCKAAKLSDAAIAAFKKNYDQLVEGVTGLVCSQLTNSNVIYTTTHLDSLTTKYNTIDKRREISI